MREVGNMQDPVGKVKNNKLSKSKICERGVKWLLASTKKIKRGNLPEVLAK